MIPICDENEKLCVLIVICNKNEVLCVLISICDENKDLCVSTIIYDENEALYVLNTIASSEGTFLTLRSSQEGNPLNIISCIILRAAKEKF